MLLRDHLFPDIPFIKQSKVPVRTNSIQGQGQVLLTHWSKICTQKYKAHDIQCNETKVKQESHHGPWLLSWDLLKEKVITL
jgi:hypothetical protein